MANSVMIVADLHLDQWLQSGRDPFAGLNADTLSSLDALIVAGDLADKPKVRWPHVLTHLAQYVDPAKTWILPGNHDYYQHVLDGDERLVSICADAGVHFTQKQVIIVGDTRYVCCTLWTDFALDGSREGGMYDAAKGMNDYKSIRLAKAGHRRIRPADVAHVHNDHRKWLERKLAETHDGQTVVVTHHAPLSDCLPLDHPVPAAYASDLTALIDRYQPQEWLFGHTHIPVGLRRGQTTIRNVSLGYPHQIAVDTDMQILMTDLIRTQSST